MCSFRAGEKWCLAGDGAGGSRKDSRRAAIAARWCVIAMAGDQLGDFSQQFNARDLSPPARIALATGPAASALWDRGWFLFPNPVYGPWDRPGWDDLFTSDPPLGPQCWRSADRRVG